MIIYPTSLSSTLDATSEAFFYQQTIPDTLREQITGMIIKRQCLTGVNAGFFVPYAAESEAKVKLFTGEQLSTSLAQTHIRMIEAMRVLKLLSINNPSVSQAISLADHRMEKMCYRDFCAKGECRALTIAYLRYLSLDGSENSNTRINNHLTNLSKYRDNKGKWGAFPYFFTLLMLLESNDPLANQELHYASPACEKQLAQDWPADSISKRRLQILQNIVSRS